MPKLVRHHRKSRAQKGKNNKRNISWLPKELHVAWHTIFNGHLTPPEIAEIITELFLDPSWKLIARRR
jgi:hypothetical protein